MPTLSKWLTELLLRHSILSIRLLPKKSYVSNIPCGRPLSRPCIEAFSRSSRVVPDTQFFFKDVMNRLIPAKAGLIIPDDKAISLLPQIADPNLNLVALTTRVESTNEALAG